MAGFVARRPQGDSDLNISPYSDLGMSPDAGVAANWQKMNGVT
jgi:hypothetical protein